MTRERVEGYWQSFDEACGRGDSRWEEREPKVGSTRFVVVAETDRAARAIARRAWDVHADNVWRVPFNAQAGVAVRGTHGMNVGEDADVVLRRNRVLLAGSPDTVRGALAEFLDEVGPGHNYVVASFQWGDISHEEAMHSLELYSTEVMPWLARRSADAPARTDTLR
jgi:alkanesulfonate monooxygenase SsuD/methylene tetrahydromethanopterin reductase-like flavin-dependent oxidoreductase (luciferase family)